MFDKGGQVVYSPMGHKLLAELKTSVVTVAPMLGGILMEDDQPIDDDGTKEGRYQNRHVKLACRAVEPECSFPNQPNRSLSVLNHKKPFGRRNHPCH
ncbi:MAG: hypothetical protein BA870_00850 [Desulfuromonadales bacterium C00003094]|nr:MAG: hypothetical protein BA870_00850 [Desulfuromonadales bacterium C00003094]